MSLTSANFVRDELNTYCQEHLGKSIDDVGDNRKSWVLMRYFVQNILPTLGFNEELIEHFDEGYVDGANDLGNDVVIKLGNEVHFIQAKYVGQKKNLPNEIIESWHRTFERLDRYKGHKKITEILNEIEWEKDNFYLWFITTAKIIGQSELAKESKIVIPDGLKEKGLTIGQIESDFIEQARLKEEIINSKNNIVEISKITAKIYPIKDGSKRSPIIQFDEPEAELSTVVMVVDSEQLVQIYNSHKKNIFALNVRQFLGQTKKNKTIKESAQNEPQKFFFYNNGVSGVAEKIEVFDDHISVTGLNIINGAQTIKSLYEAKSTTPQPKVLFRISEVRIKEKRVILDNIIRYNNTQNEIKSSDFRSNDFIQNHYIEEFSKLKRDGLKCEYRPKRIERGKKLPDKLIILMPDFAKYLFAFEKEPYTAEASGINSLFSIDGGKDSSYETIFGSKDELIPYDLFLSKAGTYFLCHTFLNKLTIDRKTFTETDKKESLERGTILIYVTSKILDRLEKDLPKFSKYKLLQTLASNSKWTLEGSDGLSKFMDLLYKRSLTTTHYRYRYETSTKKPPATQRSWQRGKEGIKENLLDYISIEFDTESLKEKLNTLMEVFEIIK